MSESRLPKNSRFKLDLMFEGIRFTEALGEAAKEAFPNFYPYRFSPVEKDPTGQGKAEIPYLLITENDVLSRIKGNGKSSWYVTGDGEEGYWLRHDHDLYPDQPVSFAPLPSWMKKTTSDGIPMAATGISLHSDMAVVNIAPACQYFLADKDNGLSMRCGFCAYGAPDARSEKLGQQMDKIALPDIAYRRMRETLNEVINSGEVRHIYLVGGSMVDWCEEGQRFIEIARQVQSVNDHKIPVTCGSGALPPEYIKQLYDEALVDSVCFNLEVWSKELFARVCPGKHRFVGYDRWISSLEYAVSIFGKGRVYSAMVAGIELEPEYAMTAEQALELALRGADDLCSRGIIPIYSLYWPVAGRNLPESFASLRQYFAELNVGYAEIRKKHGLDIWEGFMCHRCAYMQLECDIDRDLKLQEIE